MNVYLLMLNIKYEGRWVEGAYATHELAMEAATAYELKHDFVSDLEDRFMTVETHDIVKGD